MLGGKVTRLLTSSQCLPIRGLQNDSPTKVIRETNYIHKGSSSFRLPECLLHICLGIKYFP